MAEFKKWFERTFDFKLETWMYRNIVERLRGSPARIEDRIEGLRTEILIKRHAGSWSIQEHIGHLVDLEPLWLARLEDFEAGREELTPADLENRKTHEANHNQVPIGKILAEFREQRSRIVEKLDSYDETTIARTAKHPRLRTHMRVVDLVFFIAEHDDHHLARITELIASEMPTREDQGGRTTPARGERGVSGVSAIEAFIDAINAHDTTTLCDSITEDHVLVDSGGHVIQGIDRVSKAWDGYFAMFPDYRITAADIIEKPPWFAVVGSARGTYVADGKLSAENTWSIPAAWLAGVRHGKVRHWQVYADNDPVRRILERHHGGG